MDYFLSILIFFLGASIGSFVNVVALRWNTGLSFLTGKSRCLFCNTEIDSNNLIPIFSFINVQGRCIHCKARLSLVYLLVEIVSGLIALLAYFKFAVSPLDFLSLSLIVCAFCIFEVLLLIFIYDFHHKIIPDTFSILFSVLAFIYSFFLMDTSFLSLVFAALIVPLPFFLIWFFSGGKMLGFGDVKLMVGMGMLLGVSKGFMAVIMSFWVGAGVVLLLFVYQAVRTRSLFKHGKHLTMKSEIPFAPFLCIGTLIEFFFHFNLW